MLGSLKTEVTRKKLAYVFATRRSRAKKTVWVHSCQSPITEKTHARPIVTAANDFGSQIAAGDRATTATSAANGKMKKASSMLPCWRSRAQTSETASKAMKAAAGTASNAGSGETGPRHARTRSARLEAASTPYSGRSRNACWL